MTTKSRDDQLGQQGKHAPINKSDHIVNNPNQVSSDKPQSDKPQKKRRRRRRKPASQTSSETVRGTAKDSAKDSAKGSVQERLRHAIELIDSVAREEAKQHGVLRLSTLHLNFTIGEGDDSLKAPTLDQITRQSDKLQSQIETQIRALIPTQFQRGTVYCFHSDSGISPPAPDSVFIGYDPLGRPQWMSFLPFCLQERIPNVEQLYADPPRPIGIMMPHPIGIEPIVEVTQGRTHEVLAQLIIGPLAADLKPLSAGELRHTLTAQVILVQTPEYPLRVRFNLLGLNPDELFDAAAKSAPRAPIARARNSISSTRRSVRHLQDQFARGRISRTQLAQESENILNTLQDALLRSLSSNPNRTRHAQRRHQSMERPTSEAWRDAAKAGDERLFWDVHQETIVVIGPKGRAHIFSTHGKHVTSVRLGVGELDRKRGQRRWLILEPEQAKEFRALIRGNTP